MQYLRHAPLSLTLLLLSCTIPSLPPPQEIAPTNQVTSSSLPGYVVERPKGAPYALVLIHGLDGDGTSSWTSHTGSYWPKLMESDQAFDKFDIYVHQYPTSIFGSCMAISDLATSMHAYLKSDSVFENHEQVIFLAHSMGGLIARTFLLRYRELANKVPMVIFMATPSAGSRKADIGNMLPTCSQVEDLRTLDINSFLKNQQSDWLSSKFRDQIASYCAVETQPLAGSLVVDRSSASLLCTTEPVSLLTNHSDTVKPATIRDLSHVFLKNTLSDLPTLQKRSRTKLPGEAHEYSNQQITHEQSEKSNVPTKEPLKITVNLLAEGTGDNPPYETRFIATVNQIVSPIRLLVQCESEILDANGRLAGASIHMRGGWGGSFSKKLFGIGILAPAWSPSTPLIITVRSNQKQLGVCRFEEQ